MIDVRMRNMDVTTFFWIITILAILTIQLLLCFKVKSRVIRLLPIVLFSISTIVLFHKAVSISGWGGLLYLLYAIYSGIMTFVCGIGWFVWAIIRFIKKKKEKGIPTDQIPI